MKKNLLKPFLTALLVVVTFFAGYSQGGWEQVYSGSNYFMRDVSFVPGTDGLWNTGWAIAAEGDIIKTTDGGETWTVYSQSESSLLGGITFVDETTGFISTLDGKILTSTDGGATWTVSYNPGGGYDKVAFKDANNGCVIGTSKYYTTDGGTTWSTGSGGSGYWDLDHAGGDTYFAINLGGNLGQSTDGGQTWSDVESLGQMGFMTKFMDADNGMFGGDVGKLKVTHDGGSSWITNTIGGGSDAINTGGFFDADTIYVAASAGEIFKSTDGGTNWSSDTAFNSGVFMPRGMVVTGMNVVFVVGFNSSSEGLIWRRIGTPPIDADFTASDTVVCAGSMVDFTDLSFGAIDSWSWEFEGGTPATSTDQNPTVTYNSTGFFDVKLVVTIGSLEDSLIKTNYIEVVELPAQASIPDGETSVCTDQVYNYTISAIEFAHEYEWELSPANAGILTWDDSIAELTVDAGFTGDFTLRARASNVCGDGDWSDYLQCTANESPGMFTVEGGGGFCLDGDGVEVTLNGSETGTDYELYLDGIATGNIVAGTGSSISFGLVTDEGYYTVFASNTNCTIQMDDQAYVFLLFPPLEPDAPTGPDAVCNNETSDYESTGSDDADSYVWVLTPDSAGALTAVDLSATVEWSSDFSGTANISLYGVNDCGDGNPSTELEVTVDAVPSPEVTGPTDVCDNTSELYSTEAIEEATFTWEVSGGSISEGQGTNSITVEWGEPGDGSVYVSAETSTGCIGLSDTVSIFIDNCTSIKESLSDHEVSVYPNPAHETVNIKLTLSREMNGEIFLLNQIGATVFSEIKTMSTGNQNMKINVSMLPKGIYLLGIKNADNTVYKKKIVIE